MAQGWTGRKCPSCNGNRYMDDSGVSCPSCGGTGEEWGDLPEEPVIREPDQD